MKKIIVSIVAIIILSSIAIWNKTILLAKLGDSGAQFEMAKKYLEIPTFIGVEEIKKNEGKNPVLGFRWLLKAAQNDNFEAQQGVSYCYENGVGVARDYIKAVYWYEQMVLQWEHWASASILASKYLNLLQDAKKAEDWYERSFELDNSNGGEQLLLLYLMGDREHNTKWPFKLDKIVMILKAHRREKKHPNIDNILIAALYDFNILKEKITLKDADGLLKEYIDMGSYEYTTLPSTYENVPITDYIFSKYLSIQVHYHDNLPDKQSSNMLWKEFDKVLQSRMKWLDEYIKSSK